MNKTKTTCEDCQRYCQTYWEFTQIEADDQKWWQSNYQILPGSKTVENILSIKVLEWLVILVGCKIKGIHELEARQSKNSFV